MTVTNQQAVAPLRGNLQIEDVGRTCYAIDNVLGDAPIGRDRLVGTYDQLPTERQEVILSSVNAVLGNPTITPEQLHTHWMETMEGKGWKRAATTDVTKKQHARLVPFAELPQTEQVKARAFIEIVTSLMLPNRGGLRTEP